MDFARLAGYDHAMVATVSPVGRLIKDWRQRRRMSQLDLAYEAELSSRHLSFIETGRSSPSREMVMRLAKHLDVPLRDRNAMLTAAGFVPAYTARGLDDPSLAPARTAIELLLKNQEPFPALAVDRHWNVLALNSAARDFLGLSLGENVYRSAFHPDGLSAKLVNLVELKEHAERRVRRQFAASGDLELKALLEDLQSYPPSVGESASVPVEDVMLTVRIANGSEVLSFFSTTTVFGAPADITLSEIAIESFYPADEATAKALGISR